LIFFEEDPVELLEDSASYFDEFNEISLSLGIDELLA